MRNLEQLHARITAQSEVLFSATEAQRQQYTLQAFYDIVINEPLGSAFIVPLCNRSVEEIKRLEEGGRMLLYVHPEVSTSEAGHLLAATLPGLQSTPQMEYRNLIAQHGWVDVERTVETPRLGVSPKTLKKEIKAEELEPQTVNTYALASEYSRFLYGKYFDEYSPDSGNSAFLLGSSGDEYGRVLLAGYSVGESIRLRQYHFAQDRRNGTYGARTAGRVGRIVIEQMQPGSMTVEQLVTSLGYGKEVEDTLEMTIRVINLLEARHGLVNVRTDTVIPSEVLGKMQSNVRQEIADSVENMSYEEGWFFAEEDDDTPQDVRDEIVAEFDSQAPSESVTVFQVPPQPTQLFTKEGRTQAENDIEEARAYNAVDVLREVVGPIPSGRQRNQANNVAKTNGLDPDKLSEPQRDILLRLLKTKFLK